MVQTELMDIRRASAELHNAVFVCLVRLPPQKVKLFFCYGLGTKLWFWSQRIVTVE